MKTFILLCCLLLTNLLAYSQQLELQYRGKALSEILLDLRDRYDFQFSFDNDQLSNYKITVDHSFKDLPETLDFLFKNLPLTYEKAGEVFLIYNRPPVQEPALVSVSGIVQDEFTGESLPYAHLYLGDNGLLTDRNGAFSYKLAAGSLIQLRISFV